MACSFVARGTEYGVLPDPYHLGVNDFGVETWVGGTSLLPYSGELTRKEVITGLIQSACNWMRINI